MGAVLVHKSPRLRFAAAAFVLKCTDPDVLDTDADRPTNGNTSPKTSRAPVTLVLPQTPA